MKKLRTLLPWSIYKPVREISRKLLATPPHKASGTARRGSVVCTLYKRGDHDNQQLDLKDAFDALRYDEEAFVWIQMVNPSVEDFAHIALKFELHPLAIEDAVHAHQRPKLDTYEDHAFLVLKAVHYVDQVEVIKASEVMVFIGHGFLITVRNSELQLVDEVKRVVESESRDQLMLSGPAAVLYALADRIVDDYQEALVGLEADIEEVESQVFETGAKNPTERIYKLKQEVFDFRRAVEPLAVPLKRIVDGELPVIADSERHFFRDVEDHLLRTADRLNGFDAQLSDALAANVAQVTLRQNEDMRKIAAWAAIISCVTAVAGVYGMNFEHMPELGWQLGYPMALGMMLVLSVGLYVIFRKKHWL